MSSGNTIIKADRNRIGDWHKNTNMQTYSGWEEIYLWHSNTICSVVNFVNHITYPYTCMNRLLLKSGDYSNILEGLLFNPTQKFISYIMVRTNTFSMLNGIFIVQSHWNNSPRIDMSPHPDTLSWFRAIQSLLFHLNAACLVEKQQIPFS